MVELLFGGVIAGCGWAISKTSASQGVGRWEGGRPAHVVRTPGGAQPTLPTSIALVLVVFVGLVFEAVQD